MYFRLLLLLVLSGVCALAVHASVFRQRTPTMMSMLLTRDAGGGGSLSREDVPGGVGDVKRISERVTGGRGQRMRALLDMGEVCLEVL